MSCVRPPEPVRRVVRARARLLHYFKSDAGLWYAAERGSSRSSLSRIGGPSSCRGRLRAVLQKPSTGKAERLPRAVSGLTRTRRAVTANSFGRLCAGDFTDDDADWNAAVLRGEPLFERHAHLPVELLVGRQQREGPTWTLQAQHVT